MVHAIDTLGFAKRLRESGIPEDKAEALAFAIREFIVPVGTIEAPKLSGKTPEQLATKTDVAGLTARLIAILRKTLTQLMIRICVIGFVAVGITIVALLLSLRP